jgi:hypothetical protein
MRIREAKLGEDDGMATDGAWFSFLNVVPPSDGQIDKALMALPPLAFLDL